MKRLYIAAAAVTTLVLATVTVGTKANNVTTPEVANTPISEINTSVAGVEEALVQSDVLESSTPANNSSNESPVISAEAQALPTPTHTQPSADVAPAPVEQTAPEVVSPVAQPDVRIYGDGTGQTTVVSNGNTPPSTPVNDIPVIIN